MKIFFLISLIAIPFFSSGQTVNRTGDLNFKNRATFGTQTDTYTKTDTTVWLQIGENNTTKGILMPRLADTLDYVGHPTAGTIIYQNSDNKVYFYNGTYWSSTASTTIPNLQQVTSVGNSTNTGINVTGSSTFANTNIVGNAAINGIPVLQNTATGNTVIGIAALPSLTAGKNTAYGFSTLSSTTTASSNVAIGYASMDDNTTGSNNTSIGVTSLFSNQTGNTNVAMGADALYYTTNSYNTGIGGFAGEANTNSIYNTFLGYNSGESLAAGTTGGNTLLGANTEISATGDNNETVIGYNSTGKGSNTFTLGNSTVIGYYFPSLTNSTPGNFLTTNSSGLLQFASVFNPTITTPSSGQLLSYNGTNWINFTPNYAPATGGTGYIQNQFSSAQTSSSYWIDGNGRINGNLGIGGDSLHLWNKTYSLNSSGSGFFRFQVPTFLSTSSDYTAPVGGVDLFSTHGSLEFNNANNISFTGNDNTLSGVVGYLSMNGTGTTNWIYSDASSALAGVLGLVRAFGNSNYGVISSVGAYAPYSYTQGSYTKFTGHVDTTAQVLLYKQSPTLNFDSQIGSPYGILQLSNYPNSFNGGIQMPIATSSVGYTVTTANYTVINTAGTNTFTMPAASTCNGQIFHLVCNTGTVTLSVGYLNYAGTNTTSLTAGTGVTIQSNGTAYYQIGQ